MNKIIWKKLIRDKKLISFCQLLADNKVRRTAELKNDSIMLAVTSGGLTAEEVSYHSSC